MARSTKIAILGSIFAVSVALVVFVVMAYLRTNPPTVNFVNAQASGQPVNLEVQTVGSIGYGPHPTWVSYLVRDPQGNWVHSTLWQLPAHTRINVTILQFDSGSPLRNQQIGMITGTHVTLNGKPVSVINSNAGAGVGHTFSIPVLGINVPLAGVANPNVCGAAPCGLKQPHNTFKFSFTTPGPGNYPWQCFVPCGLGYLSGNGGPMQTIGYMDGFLKVVA